MLKNDPVLLSITGGKIPSMIVAGHDAFAKKERYSVVSHENTFADVFAANGLFLSPAFTGRKTGWWSWKSLFPAEGKSPSYFIFDGLNTPLIDEMMSAVYDSNDPEDIAGKGNDPSVADHALDEQRYGIMALFRPEGTRKSEPLARFSDEYSTGF